MVARSGRGLPILIILPPVTATFTTPGRIVTGWDCREQLSGIAPGLGRRALLVTGPTALRAAGTTERLAGLLGASGVEVTLFERAEPEPTVETVDLGREAFRRGRCDLVVAAGGGSAMDVGKAIAALASGVAPTADYYSRRPLPEKFFPCVALPTTAGTGAEVTPNSVLTDPAGGVKQSIRGPSLAPAAAVVDAELTVSCPPDVTASAGMDALTQAIESHLSRHATPLTDALAVHAVKLVWGNILVAYRNGQDRPAREGMACGALLAGMALANARLGAVHGMAHPIGHRYHLRHGVVCAALLPHVLRFNRESAAEKYEILAGIFGSDPADAAARLLGRLDLPQRLSPAGLAKSDFDAIAAASMPSGSLKANPRPVTEDDIKAMLSQLL